MTVTVKLSKWGNSAGARLTAPVLETLGAQVGDLLDIDTDASSRVVTLRKHVDSARTLAELLDGWGGDTAAHAVIDDVNVGEEIG